MKSLYLIKTLMEQYNELINTPYEINGELLYPVEIDMIDLFGNYPDVGVAVISEKLHVTKSAVSQKIDRLCEKGYLIFVEKKGRNKYYRLTEKGMKIQKIHSILANKTIERISGVFQLFNESEQKTFDKILETLVKEMQELNYQKELNKEEHCE